jgi:adenosine kinase
VVHVRIALTGSIATDHLMVFPGTFSDQLVADKLDKVSLSFLVDELEVRRGGVAANIAFGLGCLGTTPVLVGSVGADFTDYQAWLVAHGVDTDAVRVSTTKHTARFLCTTDAAENQIASFYAGAMADARHIELAEAGPFDLVVVSPNDPAAMVRHTRECRELGYPFAADPSQQLARLDGAQVRGLVTGARYVFTNEYEAELLLRTTGWSHEEVLGQVDMWLTTRGADGVVIHRAGDAPLVVDAVPAKDIADPTGVGDGFRAGFLWGQHAGLSVQQSAQVGCTLASIVLETVGSQTYVLDRSDFSQRVARTYGEPTAADIECRLRI